MIITYLRSCSRVSFAALRLNVSWSRSWHRTSPCALIILSASG